MLSLKDLKEWIHLLKLGRSWPRKVENDDPAITTYFAGYADCQRDIVGAIKRDPKAYKEWVDKLTEVADNDD